MKKVRKGQPILYHLINDYGLHSSAGLITHVHADTKEVFVDLVFFPCPEIQHHGPPFEASGIVGRATSVPYNVDPKNRCWSWIE